MRSRWWMKFEIQSGDGNDGSKRGKTTIGKTPWRTPGGFKISNSSKLKIFGVYRRSWDIRRKHIWQNAINCQNYLFIRGFPWKKGISLTFHHHSGEIGPVRSRAIIWPDILPNDGGLMGELLYLETHPSNWRSPTSPFHPVTVTIFSKQGHFEEPGNQLNMHQYQSLLNMGNM